MASSRLIPITLAAVLLVAGGGGYYYFQRARTAEQPPAYNTTTIASGQIRQLVTATGQLDAVLSVDVGSQISGLVIKLYADFNTLVKKDQVIAEIDPATYQQKLRQAEADLASSKASNRLQQLNTQRTRDLAAKSLVTQQEVDQAEAQLSQANATLLTRQAAVENANVDLARCTIRSPIDGMVISKQTEEGKTVAASLNAPTLFTIANDQDLAPITQPVAAPHSAPKVESRPPSIATCSTISRVDTPRWRSARRTCSSTPAAIPTHCAARAATATCSMSSTRTRCM